MDKKRLKEAIKSLTVAGLIAGMSFITGSCQKKTTEGANESTGMKTQTTMPSGEGAKESIEMNTEGMSAESGVASGETADKPTEEMNTGSGTSCGKGSCGQ